MKTNKTMPYKDLYLTLNIKTISLCILILIIVFFFNKIYKEQNMYSEIINNEFKSEKIINEIRQNSEDLTRLARLYTNTKDTLYRNQYFEVLNINKGEVPRPRYYNRIYWNILTTKDHQDPPFIKFKRKSTDKLIEDADFEPIEEQVLKKAMNYSLSLTNLEIEAFYTLEGLSKDVAVSDTISNQKKAIGMVNSKHYHQQVILIMEELNKAYDLLEKRTNKDLNNLKRRIKSNIILIFFIFIMIILNIFLIIFSTLNLKKETINQLKTSVKNKTKELRKSVQLNKKIAKDLRELNASKDMFFSIISHDLKGPFNSLIGFSDLLLEQVKDDKNEKDEELLESVEIIKNVSQNTFELLQNLLEWAQMQKGSLQFNREDVRVIDIIDDVLKVLSFQSIQKKIEIERVLPDNDLMVYADKNMVSTIIRNLISNAIKYSYENGKIVIKCVAETNCVKFSVSDSGIGISKGRIKKMFEFKYSQKTLGTHGEKGTGLGLILSKGFINKHNGEIWVESEIGKGATFVFTLPIIN